MALIRFPSVQLDVVTEDTLDATQAAIAGTLSGPFDFGLGGTFTIAVDGGSAQTINFEEVHFLAFEEATLEEAVIAINSQLTGATASVVSDTILLESDTYGSSSELIVTNGTLAIITLLGLGSGSPVSDTGTDATDGAVLINRNPEPDATGVPIDSNIYLEIAGTDGVAPLESDLTIAIGATTVWNGTAWMNGYAGTIATPFTDVLTVLINPPNDFATSEAIEVRITLSTPSLDETYSFIAADSAAPTITSVQGRDETTLRVTFSEPVIISSPSATEDALNPSNYSLERLSRPAVSASVTSVNQVSSSVVDLTVDTELTFGASYMLVVSGVEDIEGNAIIAPNNTLIFNAYSPPCPNGRRFRLIEFLPDLNRSEDAQQDLHVFIAVFQEVVNLLLVSIDKWAEILDVDLAPEEFLDAMLADLGNPFSEFDLDESNKRRLLHVLVEIYKLKGTARGIIDAIRFFLGIEVTIEIFNGYDSWELTAEGFEATIGNELNDFTEDSPDSAVMGPGLAEVYSFIVNSPNVILTIEEISQITSIVELMKPGHTHLIAVTDATPDPGIDHVELGFSILGSDISGENAGTFTLHE